MGSNTVVPHWVLGGAALLHNGHSALQRRPQGTAHGDLHHQPLLSVPLQWGFSKAKGSQLHHASELPPNSPSFPTAMGHCKLRDPTPGQTHFTPVHRDNPTEISFKKRPGCWGANPWDGGARGGSGRRRRGCTLGLTEGDEHPCLPEAVTAQ